MADLRESVRGQFLASADNYQTAQIGPEDARKIAGLLEINGSTSDGFHTFDELYLHRKLLNAGLFRTWHIWPGPEGYGADVHKSWRHSDGELCFGGGWFIVVAQLPAGQISYHYPAADWDLFQIPERELPAEFDGHTAEDVVARLEAWLRG